MPPARLPNRAVKWVSFAAFVMLIASFCELWLQGSLVARHPALFILQAGAALLMLWSQASLGWRSLRPFPDPTRAGLFTGGPYRLIRHPIYAAVLAIVLMAVVSHPTRPVISLVVLIACVTAIRIVAEERLVTLHYPQYRDYAARTKRLIPFVI